jgi:ubiquitin carboxyl-terminal hydrolase 8
MVITKNLDLSRYHNKGRTGLANLGNTCFMNACLQVLNHVYELNELFMIKKLHQNKNTEKNPDVVLVNEWAELQEIIWNNTGAVSPNKFVFHVQRLATIKNKELFTGWAQNDMPEFLLFIVDCMHNSLSRSVNVRIHGKEENTRDRMAIECYKMLSTIYTKEYSEVMELLYGIYVSEIYDSSKTVIHSYKPEMFFILDLPLPPPNQAAIDLYDCLNLFTCKEFMGGENAWFNEKTNEKEDVYKQIRFWNLPSILVITMKRFSSMGNHKRQDLVTFPIEGLNLSKYVCGYESKSYVYDLMGICNHMGSVMGGHYTAFVKNSTNEWIHFNDTMHQMIDQPDKMITPAAYCLFYRKRT